MRFLAELVATLAVLGAWVLVIAQSPDGKCASQIIGNASALNGDPQDSKKAVCAREAGQPAHQLKKQVNGRDAV